MQTGSLRHAPLLWDVRDGMCGELSAGWEGRLNADRQSEAKSRIGRGALSGLGGLNADRQSEA